MKRKPHSAPRAQRRAALRLRLMQRMLSSPEGKIFFAGIVLLVAYAACITATWAWSGSLFYSLFGMTTTHILAGRAAGMSYGYAHDFPVWVVVLANMAIETFMVLLFYPVFVFSHNRLLVIKAVDGAMARVRTAAETHRSKIVKFGVPGLLLFVWFPFWMTGPLVGSVIGYLIGLRPVVNIATVLAGTYLAIVCWGVLLHQVDKRLEELGPYVPFAFVGLVILVALGAHVAYGLAKSRRKATEGQEAARRD